MFDVYPETSPIKVDCGPTCLKMLLAYYGTEVELNTLIAECNLKLDGCTGKDLLAAGRKHGLDMRAYNMSVDVLIKQDRPSIIWWRYSHWCVFCGTDDEGKCVICNPDRGRYGIDKQSFSGFYSGIALFNGEPYDIDHFAEDYFCENEPEPEYFEA